MKILIADDSRTGRSYVVKTLGIAGISESDIVQVDNGLDALEKITKAKIDILFLDINMPKMDGLELLGVLGTKGMLKNIKIIITSSIGEDARIGISNSFGVKSFLRKPFSPEALSSLFEMVKNNE